MKRTFRLLGLSALVLGLAVACNNNQPVEAAVDSVAEAVVDEEPIEDVIIDSALVADEQQAEPVVEKKKTTTTKKTSTNNTEVKVEEKPVIQANTEVKAETGLDQKSTKAKSKLKK